MITKLPRRRFAFALAAMIGIAIATRVSAASGAATDRESLIGYLLMLRTIVTVALFAATYLTVALGRLPGFHFDRSGAAMAGAALMVGIGALNFDQAPSAVDFNTLVLLLGMMIVVAHLRMAGFFLVINRWIIERAHRPLTLLILVAAAAGGLSAFLVNDAVCLVMTPLVLDLVTHLRRNPIPYLLAIAMASNAGSVATITGNPQNMIIGSLSHTPYASSPVRWRRLQWLA